MLAFYACKEERNLPLQQQQDNYVQVTVNDGSLIQKQLTWIAKGLAGISDQTALVKSEIHNLVEANAFYIEINDNLDAELLVALSYDYDFEVNQWLQANQPGNDYDQSYFFDIDIDNCPGKVSVRIPEADVIDQTKLHVVMPSNPLEEVASVMGYYISSIGLIDSITISEANMDSVYLWIVGVENDCNSDTFYSENAPMRLAPLTPPLGPGYTVRLKSIKFNTDNKNTSGNHPGDIYQEGHFAGKYQINVSCGIYDETDFSVWRETKFGDDDLSIGKYKSWGKHKAGRNVIRRHNGSKSNRGGSWTEPVNKVLADTYYPDLENFVFVLYEYDWGVGTSGSPDNAVQSRNWGYSYAPGQSNQYPINPPTSSGGPLINGELSDNWVVLEHDAAQSGPFSPMLPTGIWVQTGAKTYETIVPLDGEISSAVITLTEK
tara:strand:+ start:92 stop:1390 length:1299 start_codon:yes stop_codon:yes gene_type:complete